MNGLTIKIHSEVWIYINPDFEMPANGAAEPSATEAADKTKAYGKRLLEPEMPVQGAEETEATFSLRQTKRSTRMHSSVENEVDVREILVKLKKRHMPDMEKEQNAIFDQLMELKAGPSNQRQINAWIKSWITLYNRAEEYKVQDWRR
ncbi:hypothetical protein TSTA_029690 [Talaromyces stipitatus ATCC 10500]|uniref:Uncharacterized protein n=1 Tax=Talaromyces stipitatus (strain ATCC 10500 / CBS 375.48 / QM 6759 / NRRL 1006) TaxID=441959 RepID=B8M589_TALSN|nr:uncharacterized protein TSTA_029690 [Talaromyces stipitatus ATCC 10500]EED19695.1 hypothetical protein TSTA_029690 [Talaromyces stipitatus ATCC 10500]